MDGDNPDERFPSSGGRVLGALGMLIGATTVVFTVVDRPVSWAAVALGSFVAAVSWTTFLRPRVAIEDDDLTLRGMVQTVRVPLAAVEEVVVQQVLAVRVGERRFTSVAVGRSRRQIRSDDVGLRRETTDLAQLAGETYGLYVEERIRRRAENARDRLGIAYASPEQDALAGQVRREPAVPEIVWLAGSALVFVLLLVLT